MIHGAESSENTSLHAYITELWDRHYAGITNYFRRRTFIDPDEVRDLVQTTFERLSYKLLKNPAERPEEAIVNMQAYLYAIAHNVFSEWLRNHRRGGSFTVSSDTIVDDEGHSILDSLPDLSHTPEEAFLGHEQILDLRVQIEHLPEGERAVLYSTYFDGRTLKETSKALGLSESTVNRLLRSARLRLRKDLRSNADVNEEQPSKRLTEPKQASADSRINSLNGSKSVPDTSQLASAIGLLPDPYRSVLTLAMLEGRKYTQIAALRGCSLGTIKGQVSRGIRLLRSIQRPAQFSVSLPPPISIAPRELPHLDALSENHRMILTLREMHGFSYNQIAEHLEIPLARVKKRLHCARIAYHALLNQQPRLPRMVPRRRSIPLDELPRLNHPAYRHFYEALQLAYVDHLSDEEIAARLHRPVGTIKAHIARGIKLLVPAEPLKMQDKPYP